MRITARRTVTTTRRAAIIARTARALRTLRRVKIIGRRFHRLSTNR